MCDWTFCLVALFCKMKICRSTTTAEYRSSRSWSFHLQKRPMSVLVRILVVGTPKMQTAKTERSRGQNVLHSAHPSNTLGRTGLSETGNE